MNNLKSLRIALVLPHIFMQDELLPEVIFSPGHLALALVDGLVALGHEVTLFSPGKVKTTARNITADLSLFEEELRFRADSYIDLLKKHPFIFTTLARQVQSELISKAYKMANDGEYDIVHVYANEEELAMVFAEFCNVPTVFTHHEPFNFLVKYRSMFPKYRNLNWISISNAQRISMRQDTNWVGNIYHGIQKDLFKVNTNPEDYFAYFGRIIEPKGVHLAIKACLGAGVKLKIAGKHYSDGEKDKYWSEKVLPLIDGEQIEYVGFYNKIEDKQMFLGGAKAILMPSTWEEPFGMVMIEAMACGTPIIGLNNGAIPEVVGNAGIVVNSEWSIINNKKVINEDATINNLADAIKSIDQIDRKKCREEFEDRFTLERMVKEYEEVYYKILS